MAISVGDFAGLAAVDFFTVVLAAAGLAAVALAAVALAAEDLAVEGLARAGLVTVGLAAAVSPFAVGGGVLAIPVEAAIGGDFLAAFSADFLAGMAWWGEVVQGGKQAKCQTGHPFVAAGRVIPRKLVPKIPTELGGRESRLIPRLIQICLGSVESGYTWQDLRGQSSYRLPGTDNLGWWVGVASLIAILLHVILFFALGRIKVALGLGEQEIRPPPVTVETIDVSPKQWEKPPPPEAQEPPKVATAMLEELDMLEMLPKDSEVEIRPDIKVPEVALKMEQPARSGSLEGLTAEPVAGPKIDAEIAEMGRFEQSLKTAAEGQVIVDPGTAVSDVLDPDKFNEEMLKKGAEGRSERGLLKGFTSLEDMLGMQGNDLLDKKSMIGSDLLFAYNSDELRESAKVSLMKVVLLVDRNPGLHCWLEGHTDLIGGEEFNLDLSRRRASAVKNYLVESMQVPQERLVVKGFGWSQPIVPGGTVEEQVVNRRVEIKMRKERAGDDAVLIRPKRAIRVTEGNEAAPPKAAVPPAPVPAPPKEPPPPRARPVKEPPKARPVAGPPKAVPIEEPKNRVVPEPPRATPVPEDPSPVLRAVPVPE